MTTIVHRLGRKHGNADALSRMPCKQCGQVTLEETEQEILIIGLQTSTEQFEILNCPIFFVSAKLSVVPPWPRIHLAKKMYEKGF